MDQQVEAESWSLDELADKEFVMDGQLDEELQQIVDDVPPEPEVGTITVPKQVVAIVSQAPSGQRILQTCIDLAVFLSSKNIAYGDSALNPVRAFSKASPTEQLLVRIDDKINRLVNGGEFPGDDDILDLTGYLILYLTAKENDNRPSDQE